MKKLLKFLKNEEGIEIVEWALLCAGFALAMIAIFPTLTGALSAFYERIETELAPLPGP